MMLRLRSLIATVVSLSFGRAIAEASSNAHISIMHFNISAPLSNSTSRVASPYHAPGPDTVTNYTAYDANDHPQNTNYSVPLSEIVQVADSRWPEEEKMKAMKWQGWATVEVNLFSDVINTCGNLTGPLIYGAVWQTLNNQCPTKIGNNHSPPCWGDSTPLAIRRKSNDGEWEESLCQLRIVSSNFGNPAARTALFGALAASYEAQTANNMNCYTVKDIDYNNRYCNVAIQASVFTEDSHIYMSLSSDWSRQEHEDDKAGDWRCCETREYVDSKLDTGDVQRFKALYPKPRSKLRNVECHKGCTNDQRMTTMDVDRRLIHVMDKEFF